MDDSVCALQGSCCSVVADTGRPGQSTCSGKGVTATAACGHGNTASDLLKDGVEAHPGTSRHSSAAEAVHGEHGLSQQNMQAAASAIGASSPVAGVARFLDAPQPSEPPGVGGSVYEHENEIIAGFLSNFKDSVQLDSNPTDTHPVEAGSIR
jgi:hypothetical protein